MAAKWLKYGLCVFGGLGVGYAVGVKITKERAEKEKEQEIADIREIYRNDRHSKAPKKKEEVEEKPEITTKTSIQMEKLSEKKDKAEYAAKRYSKSFQEDKKPNLAEEENDDEEKDWKDYIHLMEEPDDTNGYRDEVLDYYADGVLAYDVSGQRIDDKDIPHLVGEDNLKLLESDDCNEIYIANDLYKINYTIIFRYQEWPEVVMEEPYKDQL